MKTETNRLEYKRELTDDIEKEIVAFLNSEGGRIYIGIEKDGSVVGVSQPDALQLQIKDKLINNIRPNIMGLFDIFVQADLQKNRSKEGTGLGLSISKSLIDLMSLMPTLR